MNRPRILVVDDDAGMLRAAERVLGTQYDACYNPLKDSSGKTVGLSYIGHKK